MLVESSVRPLRIKQLQRDQPIISSCQVRAGGRQLMPSVSIESFIVAHPERLPGTVLLGELRARGYTGGITILREHLAGRRPVVSVEPVVRFETEPARGALRTCAPW